MENTLVENIDDFIKILNDDDNRYIGFSLSQSASGNGILISNIIFDFHLFHKKNGKTDSEMFVAIANFLFNKRPRIGFGGIIFNNCKFKKGLSLDFNKKFIFSNCTFDCFINIGSGLTNRLIFNERTTFNDYVVLETNEAILTFDNCFFNKHFIADNATFKRKFRVHDCEFYGDTSFRNTKFNDLADFWCSKFYKKTIFYKTDFYGSAVFSGVRFKDNVLFTYTLIDKNLILKGVTPEKGLDLSLAIIPGEILIFDFYLSNFKSVSTRYKDQKVYDFDVAEAGLIPTKNKRETFRILKQAFITQNNIVESLPYQKLEKVALKEEYDHKKGLRNCIDKFVLFLNKWSNDYGSYPLRSIVFILLVGWFFFICSIIASNNFSFEFNPANWAFNDGVKYFFQYLIPTHRFDYMGVQTNGWFYFWDFLGRTFVGYGIYQFIQAFRKFR